MKKIKFTTNVLSQVKNFMHNKYTNQKVPLPISVKSNFFDMATYEFKPYKGSMVSVTIEEDWLDQSTTIETEDEKLLGELENFIKQEK